MRTHNGVMQVSKKTNQHSGDYVDYEIKVLKGAEAIRRRPAMYIGDLGSRGLHFVLDHLLLQGVEEFQLNQSSRVEVFINRDGSLLYHIDGPGIDVRPLREIDEQFATWGKDQSLFEVQLTDYLVSRDFWLNRQKGLHSPLTLPICAALSEWLVAANYRDGSVWTMSFRRGEMMSPLKRCDSTNRTGLALTFKPDATIFGDVAIDSEFLRRRMFELSCLAPGMEFSIRDDRTGACETFQHPRGLETFVADLNQESDALFPEVFTHEGEFEGAKIAIAFQPTMDFESHVYSFVNGEACHEGTHIKGFRVGLKQGLHRYAMSHGLVVHSPPTIEHYYEGMTAVVSLWLEDPMYEGPTRMKLGNIEMATTVSQVVQEAINIWATQRPDCIQQMVEKAVTSAERNLN